MEKRQINIDFTRMGSLVEKYVRDRAVKAGSCITYQQGDKIIRENPRTGEKTYLKSDHSKHR